MATEKIEQQIDMVLHRVRQLQTKVTEFQKQAKALAQAGEVTARESLHKVFDNGLTLLGKGLINGRKATESFVAETHRKAKNLKKSEAESVVVNEITPAPKKLRKVNPEKNLSAKAQSRKLRAKSKKPVNHHTTSARSH